MSAKTKANVLIVEDSPTQAEHLRILLESHDYRFTVARDGADAIRRLESAVPDLVVSDIVMPSMDGYELCRRIKANPATRDVPVILLSSLSETADVVRGLEAGADNFIFKPFDEAYLLLRIEQELAARDHHETRQDSEAAHVVLDGQTFTIRSHPQQILNLLVSTFETAVSRNHELIRAEENLRHLNQSLESRVQERTRELSAEIAERKRTEERLSEQAALLDKAKDAILVLDLDYNVRYWNRSAETLYGWKQQEALARPFTKLVCQDATLCHEAYEKTLSTGEWAGELTQRSKDGAQIAVEAHLTLVRDDAAQPKSILAINTNITERKKLEEQFLRAQRLESLGTLAGGVAHDLNNLLSPIVMGVDLLAELAPNPKIASIAKNIGRSANRGTDLVKQVLSFARGDDGVRETVHIDEVINEVASIIAKTFPKNIRFECRSAPDLAAVHADPTQLNQVVLNLCVNARDAMPDGGLLLVTARNVELDEAYALTLGGAEAGRYALIDVTDQGTGMSKEVIDRIFDPFFTTKEVGKGTGLGLATVNGIVRSHGGFIDVESEVGKGSSFRIHLPAQETPDAPKTPEPERERFPRGNGERILVVDDEAPILAMATQVLESFGYQALTAEDGAQAISLYAQQSADIDLVLTDLMMPVMDGSALIAALRRIDPNVRIVATSGIKGRNGSMNLSEQGHDQFLPKPYSAESLLTTLKTALGEHA